MSQRDWIIDRMTHRFVGELRIRMGSTGEGAATIVDRIDHELEQSIIAQLRAHLGIDATKAHPWSGKARFAKK